MRDPKRIETVLNVLRNVWYKYPDLRLGQLLDNISSEQARDIYYIEDEEWIELLKQYNPMVL